MRWSAVSTVAEAGLDDLAEAARRRRDDPALLPDDDAEADVDEAIARAAVGLALRRHAGRSRVVVSPEGRVVERTGKDLREVDLLVGSGGVLRNGRPGVADRIFAGSTGADVEGGWQLPRAPRMVVDDEHVLAAIGLLATAHPDDGVRAQRGSSGWFARSGRALAWARAPRPRGPRRVRRRTDRRCGARVPPLLRPHAEPADLEPAGPDPGRAGRRSGGAGGGHRGLVELLARAGAVGPGPGGRLGLAVPGDRRGRSGDPQGAGDVRRRHPAVGGRAPDRGAGQPARAGHAPRWAPRGARRPPGRARGAGHGDRAAQLRRPAGRQRRDGPGGPGGPGPRRGPRLAEERPAQRQRLPDQRLHRQRPGRDHRADQGRAGPRPGDVVRQRGHPRLRGLLHRAVLDVLLPRRRRADLGVDRPAGSPRRRGPASTAPAGWPGSR